MSVPESDPQAVNRALLDIIKAANEKGESGPLDLDALMEARGGEAAARWRAAGLTQRAWDAYTEAEQAYWETVDLNYLKLQTVATLRMAETTLQNTALTSEHEGHGWSDRLAELLATKCAELRMQVETDALTNTNAGYMLARIKMEEVSPQWSDLDELSVAVSSAGRMLDILGRRINPDPE